MHLCSAGTGTLAVAASTGVVDVARDLRRRSRYTTILVVLGLVAAWIVGIDQAVWVCLGWASGISALRVAGRWRFTVLSIALLLAMAVTGVLGASGVRWLTLARELLSAGALFGAAIGIGAFVWDRRGLRWVTAVVGFVVVSSLVSSVAVITGLNQSFQTPIAPLVPPVIAETSLGRATLVSRSLTGESYFLDEPILRPKGFFLYSTSQAVAQAVVIPLIGAAALRMRTRGSRALVVGAFVVCVVGLLLSTTRTAIAGLLLGLLVLASPNIYRSVRQLWAWGTSRPGLMTRAAVIAAMLTMLVVGAANVDKLAGLATTRSYDVRLEIYEESLRQWLERPLFGWGVEKDWAPPGETPDPNRPPLGSHSQYVGILFKHGLLGLALFGAAASLVFSYAVRKAKGGSIEDRAVQASVVVSLVAAATEELWLDPATAVVVGAAWGLALAGAGLGGGQHSEGRPAHISGGNRDKGHALRVPRRGRGTMGRGLFGWAVAGGHGIPSPQRPFPTDLGAEPRP